MESRSRTVVVVRHAQARSAGASDAARELTDEGHQQAGATGRWLAERAVAPVVALVSSAVRACETWQAMAEAAGWDLEPTVDDGLYVAGPDAALDLARATADDVGTLVVLGHNPTMGFLAQLLDDGEGVPAEVTAMAAGFPTGAAAVFDYEGPWADLDTGTARLVAFHPAPGSSGR